MASAFCIPLKLSKVSSPEESSSEVTQYTKIVFPQNLTHEQAIEKLESCSDSAEMQKLFDNFISAGKLKPIKDFSRDQNSVEFRHVFKNQAAHDEFHALVKNRNLVDVQKQQNLGFAFFTQLS